MRIIDGNIKEIILDDNDLLLVSTMKGNESKIYIKSQNGELEIDDISLERLEELKEEAKAIKAMKEYKKEQSNQ